MDNITITGYVHLHFTYVRPLLLGLICFSLHYNYWLFSHFLPEKVHSGWDGYVVADITTTGYVHIIYLSSQDLYVVDDITTTGYFHLYFT